MRMYNIIFVFALFASKSIEAKCDERIHINASANNHTLKQQSELVNCDVDSIGDLWIFTLDKTGSMLSEVTVTGSKKAWSPQQITDDVIKKLAQKGGILDQIDYLRDRITIMETGYGTKENDSFGNGFCAAAPLDSSFIHVIQTAKKFNSNQKSGLKKVLDDRLKRDYRYRESFVSQIRVLALHRLIEWICLHDQGQTFRKIHIVTITDDADENDQWKMDYYTIKRDPQKMKRLNALHSKYVYSSFTQKGGGYLNECERFTDVNSKNHIYLYDYVTLQQNVSKIYCNEDSIIHLAPLDGNTLNFRLNQNVYAYDSICFAYIDTITINREDYPIGLYLCDKLSLQHAYNLNSIRNNIIIRGKIQVQYYDSIYGRHFKSYPFVQSNVDYSEPIHAMSIIVIGLLITIISLIIFFALWIIPNREIMTVCTFDGRLMRIRHGYRWQWDKLIPLTYCDGKGVIFAKHSCYKRKKDVTIKTLLQSNLIDKLTGIIIESPVPLVLPGNVFSDNTKNNIYRNAEETYRKYPKALMQMYGNTFAGQIARFQDNRFRWVRQKLYPLLNQLIFYFCPHYYYWGQNMDGLISTTRLRNHLFILELSQKRQGLQEDVWLNTYYQGDYPVADILICQNSYGNEADWDIFQLSKRNISNLGIGNAAHLIHYHQNKFVKEALPIIKKKLKKAIRREIGVNRILFLDNTDIYNGSETIRFNVTEASNMTYICLVEDTEEEKCQILYSPLRDADCFEKSIVINSCAHSRLIWKSLLPFDMKKNRPSGDVARIGSNDIVREGVSCQKVLKLKNKTIEFDNISIKS